MELPAQAKINLSLDIVGRRPDGYHTLKMVMQSVSLCDTVSLAREPAVGVHVECSDGSVPCGGGNTVRRAAEAFFAATGLTHEGLLFRIDKRVPQQAGMGGGSADAAAALQLLNAMYRAGLSQEKMMEIGLSVGADVPFCVRGGTAYVGGIGEAVEPLPPMPDCGIVICRPPVGVSTKEAYAAFDAKGLQSTDYTGRVMRALQTGSLEELGNAVGNVFEDAGVPDDVKMIEAEMLHRGALGACMTGSGSAVYGLFDDAQKAAECREILLKQYSAVFLCRPTVR